MKKLLATTLLFASSLVAATDITIQFRIQQVTTCDYTGLPADAICEPPREYRVYAQSTVTPLAVAQADTGLTNQVPYAIDLGVEYCWEATAVNDLESKRTTPFCKTWVAAPPSGTVIIDVNATVN